MIICPGAKALPAGSSEERKGCGVKTFAAIDVGSYELSMKIFEFSPKIGIREIDHIRHRIDLGNDTFATGKISYEKVDELCRVLREFVDIMRGYKVEDFKAYGTSAIRETENTMIVLDQIRQRTGIRIEVLSNSEQRFLDYKSIALKGQDFNKIIEKGTAIVDIGGGSIQVSLFDKDTLVATQNLRLGVLRLQELLNKLNAKPSKYEGLLEEIIESQLSVFKRMYLKDRTIDNIIIVDDYVSALIQKRLTGSQTPGYVDSASYEMFMQIMRTHTKEEIAARFGISHGKHSSDIYFRCPHLPGGPAYGSEAAVGTGSDALRRHCLRVCGKK